jgi:GNAT superfamily N-acetyltransferase
MAIIETVTAPTYPGRDTYVRRPFRGQGLAPFACRALCAALTNQGRSAFYSVSFFFNAPSRRFREKLGAERTEFRLYIRCFGFWEKDLPLKRYVSRPPRERTDVVSGQSSVLVDFCCSDSGRGKHDRAI